MMDGRVNCLSNFSPTRVYTYDWQGQQTNLQNYSNGTVLVPIEVGHLFVGNFSSAFNMSGITITSTSGFFEFFIARRSATHALLYLERTYTLLGNSPIFEDVAASPNGRVAVFFRGGGEWIWRGDTLTASGYDCVLMVLDENGDLAWHRRFHDGSQGVAIDPLDAEVAIDDEGNVWLAATMEATVISGMDTIECPHPNLNDHMLVRFGGGGVLASAVVIPNDSPDPFMGAFCADLAALPNSGIAWVGSVGPTAQVGDSTIVGIGRHGLLVRFNADLAPLALAPENGGSESTFTSVAFDPHSGGLVVGGYCGTQIGFAGQQHTWPLASNCFVAFINDIGQADVIHKIASGGPFDTGSYAWITDLLITDGPTYAFGPVSSGTHLWNGATVNGGYFLTRFDQPENVGLDPREEGIASYSCWPSPASDLISVRVPVMETGYCTLTILTSSGVQVQSRELKMDNGVVEFSTQLLAPGMYLLHMVGEQFAGSARLVVE